MSGQDNELIGRQFGNYHLLRVLGKGGFATVYLGEHIYLKTQAAIKIFHVNLSKDSFQYMLTEAQVIAHLRHPHIIRVLECDLQETVPFLVMDYMPYGSVRQQHPRGARLPIALMASYVQQIAEALYYAHQHKLIHRDVKPENMLLDEEQRVLLSDFGLVVLAQTSTGQSTKEMGGTIPYMAPEQLQGKPRFASDQYSLGIVVYEWLCGERPFRGTLPEVISQHMIAEPPSLCQRVPGLPPQIEQVVFKALAKDPAERFANVRVFAQAFTDACKVLSTTANSIITSGGEMTQMVMPLQPIAVGEDVSSAPPDALSSNGTPVSSRPPVARAILVSPSQSSQITPQLSARPSDILPPSFSQPLSHLPAGNTINPSSLTPISIQPTFSVNHTIDSLASKTEPASSHKRRRVKPLLIVLTLLVVVSLLGGATFWYVSSSPGQLVSGPGATFTPAVQGSKPATTKGTAISGTPSVTKTGEKPSQNVSGSQSATQTATTTATPALAPTVPAGAVKPGTTPTAAPPASANPTPTATPQEDVVNCIQVKPTSLMLNIKLSKKSSAKTVRVTNCGNRTENWTAATTFVKDADWFELSKTSGTLNAGAFEDVIINFNTSDLSIGTHTSAIIFRLGTKQETVGIVCAVATL